VNMFHSPCFFEGLELSDCLVVRFNGVEGGTRDEEDVSDLEWEGDPCDAVHPRSR